MSSTENKMQNTNWREGYTAGHTAGAKAERELWEAEIADWLEAYPEIVFIPPKKGDGRMANNLLKGSGMTIDAFSADMARHVLRSLPERVERRRIEADDAK